MLIRTEQTRKSPKAVNSLLWSKYISVNKKKGIFYAAIESILCYSWKILTVDYKLKEILLSTEMDFSGRAAWTSRLLQGSNEVISEKMLVTQTIFETLENKQYVEIVWPRSTHGR